MDNRIIESITKGLVAVNAVKKINKTVSLIRAASIFAVIAVIGINIIGTIKT